MKRQAYPIKKAAGGIKNGDISSKYKYLWARVFAIDRYLPDSERWVDAQGGITFGPERGRLGADFYSHGRTDTGIADIDFG